MSFRNAMTLLLKPHMRLPIFLCTLASDLVFGCVSAFGGIFVLDNLHLPKNCGWYYFSQSILNLNNCMRMQLYECW